MNLPGREMAFDADEKLGYRLHGHGPVPVLLIHGLASRSECWADLFPFFDPERYSVYLVDLLGSGLSSKPPRADYSIAAHAGRLLHFLARTGLCGVKLVGHSLGGAVVLMAAIEALRGGREHLIESIVVMDGPGFIQRLPIMAEIFRFSLAGRLFVALYPPEIWVKVGLRAAYYDQRLVDREHVARYLPCYRDRRARRALVETCRSLVPPDTEAIGAWYGRLRLPVLLLWGRHDRIVPLSQGERLLQAIPGSRLEVLEACGHNPQEERPEETFRIVESFIAGLG